MYPVVYYWKASMNSFEVQIAGGLVGILVPHGTFRTLHKFGFPAQTKTKFLLKISLNRLLTSSS